LIQKGQLVILQLHIGVRWLRRADWTNSDETPFYSSYMSTIDKIPDLLVALARPALILPDIFGKDENRMDDTVDVLIEPESVGVRSQQWKAFRRKGLLTVDNTIHGQFIAFGMAIREKARCITSKTPSKYHPCV
jgi:hypothetical protein